ncbi:XdhC family protein [Flavobacteriaceae bacterium]|nr:XdhC family protein [Flavobacteriaceae bacterium]
MKELKSILQLYETYKNSGANAAIAQVVRLEESSYRREGARMLIFDNGTFIGGISGGCLEGDTLKRSKIAILKEEASLITYDTSKDDENQIGVGLGCNGVIDVLINPIHSESNLIQTLQNIVNQRKSHVLLTLSASTHPAFPLGTTFYYDVEKGRLEGCSDALLNKCFLEDIAIVLEKGKSKIVHHSFEVGAITAFIELIPAQFHLAIYGDNYDIYPMLDMAKVLDWEVSLVGNIQKIEKEKLLGIRQLFQKELPERPSIDDRTAVVLMAHDFKTDVNNLKILLDSPAGYIGLLGPKKRYDKILAKFKEEGIALTPFDLQRIHAPAGLEIGANSPEEIAASIFTEILSVFSGTTGGKLRTKKGPIHERE